MLKLIYKSILFFIIFLVIVIISTYYFTGNGYTSIAAKYLNNDQINIIKKYIFPYRYIAEQEIIIDKISNPFVNLEMDHKVKMKNINLAKMNNVKLSNKLVLKKYNIVDGFYAGINNTFPGSGYIDFHENILFVLSARGILAYSENIEKNLKLKQVITNIDDFISTEQFNKHKWFSIKDLLVHNKKIYVSYTEEIKPNCWNTSLIWSDLNYEKIEFKKLFSNSECIVSVNNPEGEFNAHQSGGKIIYLGKNQILLSVGDYRNRFLAQDENSINGKIIQINTLNSNYKIFSMGHRNPQGLFYDKNNNFILETEHGPQGGDEINIIRIDNNKSKKIQNFGWPIVSAGEHYGGKERDGNDKKYKKYPLHKSHKEYGFIEPLKSFVPSIGISEITKISDNNYTVSSLGGRSLYFFEIGNEKIINLEKVEIFERIRDIKFYKGQLFLFLEDTATIAILDIN